MKQKIGKRIKEIRLQNQLTQEEAAERAGLSYRYYQKLEGKDTPNFKIDTLIKLSKAFNTPLETFFHNI